MSERPRFDPGHPAAYQRGFTGLSIPPVETLSRRERRTRMQAEVVEAPETAESATTEAPTQAPTHTAQAATPGATTPMTDTTTPVHRPLWPIVLIASVLMIAGLAATWISSAMNYSNWTAQSGCNPLRIRSPAACSPRSRPR